MNRQISSSKHSWLLLPLVTGLVVSPFSSCSCNDDPGKPDEGPSCARRHDANNCPEGQVWRKGECTVERCDVVDGGNCCPGMACASSGECKMSASTIIKCTDSAECPSGMMCLDRPLVATDSKTCGFPGMAKDGGCPNGTKYFAGRCVMSAPCDGFCPSGQVCNIEINACENVPYIPGGDGAVDSSGCNTTCGEGELLVYEDPDSMIFDHCCQLRCRCEVLPPVSSGVVGRFADLDLGTDAVYVSSYDDTFGDLVLSRYSLENGQLLDISYIDGVPQTGHLIGSPSGLRNGLGDAGPNVGQYTSIVIHDGLPSIAYYDLDNHAVKLARKDSAGNWNISVVDNGQPSADKPLGDAGRFIDMIIGNDNRPQLSYMLVQGMLDGASDRVTGLVYAKAKISNPTSRADWDFYLADSAPLPDAACNGACPDNQSCVVTGSGNICQSNATCSSSCKNGEACVLNNGVAKCMVTAAMPVIGSVVQGVGLYTNLIDNNGSPWIVYYDSIKGALKVVRGIMAEENGISRLTGFNAPDILDGDESALAKNSGASADLDVGRFASAYLPPDRWLHVSYMDATNNELRYFKGKVPYEGYIEVVDDGVRPDGRHYVGADSTIIVNSDPNPIIAYQDSTNLDLLIANYKNSSWNKATVSPCGDVCQAGQVCATDSDSQAACMVADEQAKNCKTSCAATESCVKVNDNDYECRALKDDISNGFFAKMVWDKDTQKAYITDLEIGFDATQHRANILGVRVLNAANW